MVTKSIRCRLDCATWCEYFKSGECISPAKCKYQTEHMSVKFPEAIFMPTKEAWEKMQAENSRLTAKNAELRARPRAEVVQRAFDNIMEVFYEMLSAIFPSIKIGLDEWKKDNLAIAEKELAEEEGKQ